MSFMVALARKFRSIWPLLDERTRRIMAANEAIGLGFGGGSLVHRACGFFPEVNSQGIGENREGDPPFDERNGPARGGRQEPTASGTGPLAAIGGLVRGGNRSAP